MTSRAARIRVGCSGWEYAHWRGTFYPENLPRTRWLAHYASRFDTVEINSSFYRLPAAGTFARWRADVRSGFTFAVKASRFLTHMKKLKEPVEPLERFFGRAGELGRAFGVALYQLPPRWHRNVDRLQEFLAALPARPPQAIEFRDASWYDEEVFTALAGHAVALCLHDMAGSVSPRQRVGPFVYLRFHGGGTRYGGGYPDSVLADWATWIVEQARGGVPVWAYFNNDVGGHAPRDAARLRDAVAGMIG